MRVRAFNLTRHQVLVLLIFAFLFFLFSTTRANAFEYEWHTYNGHEYALTQFWQKWVDAEQEAVNAGGHLVTINDEAENNWLAETFRDVFAVSNNGVGNGWNDPDLAFVLIGYYYDGVTGVWKWISGEPVTYIKTAPQFPCCAGGIHAYLLTNAFSQRPGYGPGFWDAAPWITEPYNSGFPVPVSQFTRGIIERPLAPPVLTVTIYIKPGSSQNTINLGASGVIPVAVLSTSTFNAPIDVNPDTLTLAGAKVRVAGKSGKSQCNSWDVNGDGLIDLVCHFENDLNAQLGDSKAVLEGETYSSINIRGEDLIRIVP